MVDDRVAAGACCLEDLEEEKEETRRQENVAQSELPHACRRERDVESRGAEVGARPGKGHIGEQRDDEQGHAGHTAPPLAPADDLRLRTRFRHDPPNAVPNGPFSLSTAQASSLTSSTCRPR